MCIVPVCWLGWTSAFRTLALCSGVPSWCRMVPVRSQQYRQCKATRTCVQPSSHVTARMNGIRSPPNGHASSPLPVSPCPERKVRQPAPGSPHQWPHRLCTDMYGRAQALWRHPVVVSKEECEGQPASYSRVAQGSRKPKPAARGPKPACCGLWGPVGRNTAPACTRMEQPSTAPMTTSDVRAALRSKQPFA